MAKVALVQHRRPAGPEHPLKVISRGLARGARGQMRRRCSSRTKVLLAYCTVCVTEVTTDIELA